MAEATDAEVLAAIGRLRSARVAHFHAHLAKEAAEQAYRSAQDAYAASLAAVAAARQELDQLADDVGLSRWID